MQKGTAVPAEATEDDHTGLAPHAGVLKKKGKTGLYGKRYFELRNGYLNYYESEADFKKGHAPAGSIAVTEIVGTDQEFGSGQFTLRVKDSTIHLSAADENEAGDWLDAIAARQLWAKQAAAASKRGGRGSIAGAKGAAGGSGKKDAGAKASGKNTPGSKKGGKGGKKGRTTSVGTDDDEDGDDAKDDGSEDDAPPKRGAKGKKPARGSDDDDDNDTEGEDTIAELPGKKGKGAKGSKGAAGGAAGGKKANGASKRVVKQGWLKKRVPFSRVGHDRFFVLAETTLKHFKAEGDKDFQGVVHLADVERVYVKGRPSDCVFVVAARVEDSLKDMELIAPSRDEMEAWVDAITTQQNIMEEAPQPRTGRRVSVTALVAEKQRKSAQGKQRGRGGDDDDDDDDDDDGGGARRGGRRGGHRGVINEDDEDDEDKDDDEDDDDDDEEDEDERPDDVPEWLWNFVHEKDPGARIIAVTKEAGAFFADTDNNLTKTLKAATAILEDLDSKAMTCHDRGEMEALKVYIKFYQMEMIRRVSDLTSGNNIDQLPPPDLVRFMDWIDSYTRTFRRILRDCHLKLRDLDVDVEAVRDLASTMPHLVRKYVGIVKPKIQDWVMGIASRNTQGRTGQVEKKVGSRVGTSAPEDLFTMMNENLALAKTEGTVSLKRQLLATVMEMLSLYHGVVITDLYVAWDQRNYPALSIDYVCAIVNDVGTCLDHLEAMEAEFSDALGAREEDSDGEEEKDPDFPELKDDLDNLVTDLPRTKNEVLKAGLKAVDMLRNLVLRDVMKPMEMLFGPEWVTGNSMASVVKLIEDYCNDYKRLLSGFFFDRLVVKIVSQVSVNYIQHLFALNEQQSGLQRAFNRGFKLPREPHVLKLLADVEELRLCCHKFLEEARSEEICMGMLSVTGFFSCGADKLADAYHEFAEQHIDHNIHIMKAALTALQLRGDLSQTERKDLTHNVRCSTLLIVTKGHRGALDLSSVMTPVDYTAPMEDICGLIVGLFFEQVFTDVHVDAEKLLGDEKLRREVVSLIDQMTPAAPAAPTPKPTVATNATGGAAAGAAPSSGTVEMDLAALLSGAAATPPPPPQRKPQQSQPQRGGKAAQTLDSDDEDDDDDAPAPAPTPAAAAKPAAAASPALGAKKPPAQPVPQHSTTDDSDSDGPPARKPPPRRGRAATSDDDDDDDGGGKSAARTPAPAAKPAPKQEQKITYDDDDDDDVPARRSKPRGRRRSSDDDDDDADDDGGGAKPTTKTPAKANGGGGGGGGCCTIM